MRQGFISWVFYLNHDSALEKQKKKVPYTMCNFRLFQTKVNTHSQSQTVALDHTMRLSMSKLKKK